MSKIVLTNQYASGRFVNLREVRLEDAEFILQLRCDENKARFLHKTDFDLKKQESYIRRYLGLDDEYYFIITDKNHTPIGTIRMYELGKDDFVSGSWLMLSQSSTQQVLEGNYLMLNFAYHALNYRKFRFDVRVENRNVATFHKTMGAVVVAQNELDYFFEANLEEYIANLARLLNADCASATIGGGGNNP